MIVVRLNSMSQRVATIVSLLPLSPRPIRWSLYRKTSIKRLVLE